MLDRTGNGIGGLGIMAGAVLAFLLLPMLIIVWLSFSDSNYTTFPPPALSLRWYDAVLGSSGWRAAFGLSFIIAAATAAISVALGIGAALALVRGSFPFKKVIYALMLAPLILPTVITALAIYFFFASMHFAGSAVAIIAGHTVLSLPVALIVLCATIQGVDVRLEQAAASMGASPPVILRRITLPLAAPGLATAAIFAFLSSFDEFFIALFLSSPTLQTLPIRIWNSLQYQIEPSVTAVSTLLIALTVGGLGIAQLLRAVQSRQRSSSR